MHASKATKFTIRQERYSSGPDAVMFNPLNTKHFFKEVREIFGSVYLLILDRFMHHAWTEILCRTKVKAHLILIFSMNTNWDRRAPRCHHTDPGPIKIKFSIKNILTLFLVLN